MPLPPSFLDELRARTPLPSVVGRRVRLARNGRQWKGCCPFHNEKTPSFYVYEDHFHCFGCGAHGDAIGFTMQTEGLAFREAVERLAGEAGLDVPKDTPQQAAREARARDLHGVLEAAAEAMARRLRAPEGREGLAYLRKRGLSEETIARFGLGWSGAGRGALAEELRPLGIEPARLVEAGLMKPAEGRPGAYHDLFFNRVIFPIRDRRGRVVSFGGRILGDGQPKYVNGPETELFAKRRTLYGLDLAREACFRGARLVAVEGYMDVIALHQAGFGGAVAPLGTALTEEQLAEMWKVTPEPVLCFDGDAAGTRAAARAAELALPHLSPERTLRFVFLPKGEDPDTVIGKGGKGAFEALLKTDKPLSAALYDLMADGEAMATPEKRAALRNRLVEVAGRIPDRSLAAEYRGALLDRFFASKPRRGGGQPAPRRAPPSRPAIDPGAVRVEQARCVLAILLAHPWMLGEVEEAFAMLEMPPGPAAQLQAGLLAWYAAASVAGGDGGSSLDSGTLISHLHASGLAEAHAWAVRREGLPGAARADAQPGEALDGWWHFFGPLRGEDALVEDQRAAMHEWVKATDEAARRGFADRMVRLSLALSALRRFEAGLPDEEGAAAPA